MRLQNKIVKKSWGGEIWIVNNDKYCGKILYVKKDKYCSFHFHKLKTETFFILSGLIQLQISDSDDILNSETHILEEGDTWHIPVGTRHRFTALKDSKILEVSTHHEDSDSIRILPSCPVD